MNLNNLASLGVLAILVSTTQAQQIAFDSAADAVYNGGGNFIGLNGGFGWSAWSINGGPNNNSQGGAFIGSSVGNGFGTGPGINTSGRAWGIYSNNVMAGWSASRLITAGPMQLGWTMNLNIDNGFVDPGRSVLVTFLGTSSPLTVRFGGSDANYTGNVGSNFYNSGVGFTEGGLAISYHRHLNGTSGMLSLRRLTDGVSFNIVTPSLAPTGVAFQSFGAGSGPAYDFYFNNMEVVPEPATMTVLGLAAAALARRRRKNA